MTNRLLVASSFLCISLFCSTVFGDIVIDGYTAATNDRFTNSASFILNGHDLSGIGQTDGGTSGSQGRWATAISRNVIISAYHYRPGINNTIYFYPGNDPSVMPVERHVVSGQKIAGTDLYVGVLNEILPGSIKHYDFAQEQLSGTPPNGDEFFLSDAGIYQGLNSYMFGKSPFDHNSDPNDDRTSYNDQAVGRNIISGFSENVPFAGNNDNDSLLMLRETNGDPDYVQYESIFRGGDSGGPLFVEINGELRLLGTNAFLLTGDVGSGVNYTGNQAAAINSFINANAIPEPASGLILLPGLAICLLKRRRQSA